MALTDTMAGGAELVYVPFHLSPGTPASVVARQIHALAAEIDAPWKVAFTNEPKPINQSDDLPEELNLPKIDLELTDHFNWIEWNRAVKYHLKTHGVANLINKSIPRPPYGIDPATDQWKDYSGRVAEWLLGAIHRKIRDKVIVDKHQEQLAFADDVWLWIQEECRRYRLFAAINAAAAFRHVQASDHTSVESYTKEYLACYYDLKQCGFKIDPRMLLYNFVEDVRKLDSKLSDGIIEAVLDAGLPPADFTVQLLQNISIK